MQKKINSAFASILLDISVGLENLRGSPYLPCLGIEPIRPPLQRPPIGPTAGHQKPLEPGGERVLAAWVSPAAYGYPRGEHAG